MIVRVRPSRAAFTVLEIVVVISIIALLAAISVSAVFRLQEGQRESNTNTHLQKIHMVLEQQRKAAMDDVKQKPIPDQLRAWTADAAGTPDPARARALHTKLMLRREFPQRFREVQVNTITDGTVAAYYRAKDSYVKALTGTTGGTAHEESAALLYLILSQGRGGATTKPDDLGPTQTITIGNKEFSVLVDEWRQPIGFRRWYWDGDEATNVRDEMNRPPFAATGTHRDVDDPDGKLLTPTWGNRSTVQDWFKNALNQQGGLGTVGLFPPAPDINNNEPFNGFNRVLTAVSIGKDETPATADDLYSFRLQQAGRGN